MLQAELKILGGKHQGKLIPLTTKRFLVGREQDCHLRPNSDLVSRHHCVFLIDDYAIRLRDLGSTNGTLVNGGALRGEVILKSGDRVTIGKLELEIVIRQTSSMPSPPPVTESPSVTPPATSPNDSTAELATHSDGGETNYELAAFAPSVQPGVLPADTAIIGNSNFPAYPPGYAPISGYPPMMPPGYPMPGGYMPQQYPQYPQGQFPPGYGQQPMYGQPMGYPMGYPQMMPMQQPYPAPMTTGPVAAEVEEEATVEELAVRLPNPDETGAKPVAPPAAAGAKKVEMPSTSAADIIKQYMNRRS